MQTIPIQSSFNSEPSLNILLHHFKLSTANILRRWGALQARQRTSASSFNPPNGKPCVRYRKVLLFGVFTRGGLYAEGNV